MMWRLPTILLLALTSAALFNIPVLAQSSQTDGASSRDTATFLSEIMSEAEDRGMQIIVIDPATRNGISSTSTSDVTEKKTAETSVFMQAQSDFISFRRTVKLKTGRLPDSIDTTIQAIKKKSPNGTIRTYLRALYWSIVLLLLGYLVEREIYLKRIVQRWLASGLRANPVGYTDKIPLLIKQALLQIVGVIISMTVAFMTGSMLFRDTPPESIQFTIAVIYISYAATRVIGITWRMLLAPVLCQYRIPQLSNKDAARLYHWLWATATINIVLLMFSVWVGELGGNSDINAFLASILGFTVALINTLMVLVNRQAITRVIRHGKQLSESSPPVRFLSRVWLPAAVIYFLFSWLQTTYRLVLEIELSAPLIAGAYAILISVLIVYGLINYVIERLFDREKHYVILDPESSEPVTDPENQSPDASQSSAVTVGHSLNTYQDLARRLASILSLIAGFWALTKIWSVENAMLYNNVVTSSLDFVVIIFIGYVIYHIVRIWIDNKIREEGGDIGELVAGDEGGASGASRLATLLPLFRNFMLAIIAVSVSFSALLEIGVNVSPLFAGAGVIGLAIGFGAQTLVRDIFSGAFYLFDDAFRRGEYVDIGTVKGTVEKISLRSFQLRHHLGPLHTIPFGEILFLTNYSRDWVMMKLPLRLTYDTDPERVRKLVKKLGLELMEDPEIGDTFLQPLKSQGVIEMQDSAMIVRVKFMAKPGDQWVIRKRVFQEIRELFQREGIKFAHREVTVRLAGDGDVQTNLTQQEKQTVAAAALEDETENDISTTGDDR